jgi:hypothetical protein
MAKKSRAFALSTQYAQRGSLVLDLQDKFFRKIRFFRHIIAFLAATNKESYRESVNLAWRSKINRKKLADNPIAAVLLHFNSDFMSNGYSI